jgi:hypothetical protein
MKRASFFGAEFLSGVAVGAGAVAGVLGILKLHAVCKAETTSAPETHEGEAHEGETHEVDAQNHAPEKKPRASRRGKSGATAPRKSSEHDVHRAKTWKN